MDLHLTGKIVLITGSSGGIGKETARAFLQEGARVILNGTNAEKLENTRRELAEDFGADVVAAKRCDVTDEEAVIAMFREVEAEYGYLDILVNNAGTIVDSPIAEMTYQQWRKIFAVNLDSFFLCTREAVKLMKREHDPVILNCGSVAALNPAMGYGAYSMTKAAVTNLTKVTCGELAPKGIRVLGYMPGMTDTEINKDVFAAEPERICAQIPLGRVAQPEEIGRVVAFLASELAAYMAGSMVQIDGGKLCVQNPQRYKNQ